jgi:hypothetical protein
VPTSYSSSSVEGHPMTRKQRAAQLRDRAKTKWGKDELVAILN